jgi:hypothetical protein
VILLTFTKNILRSLIFVVFVLFVFAKDARRPDNTAQSQSSGAEYVGSVACARCHKEIYETFSKTGMGRSMSKVIPELLKTIHAAGAVSRTNLNLHLESYARDGKLYQSEYETSTDGHEVFRDTREIEWIVGAGENGFGGIGNRDDYLFQAPLSFYSKPQRWELSPGYELGNYGFSRPILPACVSCHSGRPNAIPESNGRFANPAFFELAIGCENCHGPGLYHVLAMQADSDNYQGHSSSIVNPARLAPSLADNICIACHQTGDVRVLKPGKTQQDFRPGTPLDNTLSILMVPPNREAPPQADLLEHYYSMTLSKCYRASGEKLSCITCHDPHVEPSRDEGPAYFAKKCLTCHGETSCTVPLEVRQHQHPRDDCAGCHMPKRDVRDISHSAITNHRILIRPGEGFPEAAFHQTTAALPDLIHLNPAPGQKEIPPPPITLLQAYGELLEKHPEYSKQYIALLDKLEQTDPGNSLVQAALGGRDLHGGKYNDAVAHLQRALQIGPPRTFFYTELAEALSDLGRTAEAVPLLRKAIDLDPFNSVIQKILILRFIQLKDYVSAKAEMDNYMQRFPEDSFMRQMLARAQSADHPQ